MTKLADVDYEDDEYPFKFSEEVEEMRDALAKLAPRKNELMAFVDNISLKNQHTNNVLELFGLDYHYMFIYDWHRKGMPNHGQLKDSDFIGETVTCDPDWNMMVKDIKGLQVLTPSSSTERGSRILGEVYRVKPELILAMDRYQIGYNKFVRKRINIKINPFLQDNKNATNCLKCHTYMLLDKDEIKKYTKYNRIEVVKSVGLCIVNKRVL